MNKICEPYTVGAYVVFWYDRDEYGDIEMVDEVWRFSFDDALDEVRFSWGLPFEICRFGKFDKESRTYYQCVARSKQFASL